MITLLPDKNVCQNKLVAIKKAYNRTCIGIIISLIVILVACLYVYFLFTMEPSSDPTAPILPATIATSVAFILLLTIYFCGLYLKTVRRNKILIQSILKGNVKLEFSLNGSIYYDDGSKKMHQLDFLFSFQKEYYNEKSESALPYLTVNGIHEGQKIKFEIINFGFQDQLINLLELYSYVYNPYKFGNNTLHELMELYSSPQECLDELLTMRFILPVILPASLDDNNEHMILHNNIISYIPGVQDGTSYIPLYSKSELYTNESYLPISITLKELTEIMKKDSSELFKNKVRNIVIDPGIHDIELSI